MSFQTVFKRYELKYILTQNQKEKVLTAMKSHMEIDQYGKSNIRNLYYDTDTYLLIRRSIEKPTYKEKLRIRSYGQATAESPVFVELKKKYKQVVYKRRIELPNQDAMAWLSKEAYPNLNTQISREVDYFLAFYKTLRPTVFISYDREAYYASDGTDLRITFDDTILCRQEDLSLESDVYGVSIFPQGKILMEIKCSSGIPTWMTEILSKERIYKTSFSKYGMAYRTQILSSGHLLNVYNTLEVNTNV